MGEKKDQVLNQVGITICIALVLLVVWVFFLEKIVLDLAGTPQGAHQPTDRWVFALATLGMIAGALIYPFRKLFAASSQLNQAQANLTEERNLNRIFSTVDNSILILTDAAGKITQINQKASQVLGYREKELIGRDWVQTLLAENVRVQAKKLVQNLQGDRSKPIETFRSGVLGKNKTELIVEWQAAALGSGGGLVLSGNDQTSQSKVAHLQGELDKAVKQYEPQIRQLSSNLSDNKKRLEEEIQKNRQTRAKFQFWLDMDKNLLSLGDAAPADEIDQRVQATLGQLGTLTGADYGHVFLFVDNNTQMLNTHIWSREAPELKANPEDRVRLDTFPWFKKKILGQEIIQADTLDQFPDEASYEKDVFQSQGVKSLINLPLVWRNQTRGYIGLEKTQAESAWNPEEVSMLRFFTKALGPLLTPRTGAETIEVETSSPVPEKTAETAAPPSNEAEPEPIAAPPSEEDRQELEAMRAEYEEKVQALKSQLEGQQEQWKSDQEELSATQSRLEKELDLRKKAEEDLEETRNNVQQELIDLNAELDQARFQLEEGNEEKARLTEELNDLKSNHENTIQELNQQLESARSEEEVQTLNEEHSQKLEEYSRNLADAEEVLHSKAQELESLENHLQSETQNKQELENQLQAITQKLQRQEQENRALNMAQGMLQSELEDLKNAQKDFDISRMEMQEKEKSFEDIQKELESDLEVQKQLVDTLESQVKQYGRLGLPILTLDADGVITGWNEAAENELGPSAYEAVGQRIHFILPDWAELDLETELLTPLAEQGACQITLPLIMLDGESHECQLSFTALRNPEGAFDGGIAYVTPVRRETNKDAVTDSVFEYSDLLAFSLAPGFEVLNINPAAGRFFDFERKDVFEKEFFDLVLSGEQAGEFREDVLDVFQSKANSDFECAVKTAHQEERTLLWNLIKRENENGELAGVLAIGQDLTEFRNSEKQLKEKETLLHSIVDNSGDGFITIDENGIIQSFNSGAEKVFGYPSKETIGQNINMLMPEPYRSEHSNYISNYLMSGNARLVGKPAREFMAQKKDGSVFPVEVAVREMYQDYRRLFIGIVHDITRRKMLEQALKESEEKFRKVLAAESDAIVIINASTKRIVEVNDAAVKLFGYDRDEILRLKLTDVTTEPEKTVTNGNGGGLGHVSLTPLRYHKKKDGTIFPAEVSASTFMAHNQKLTLRVVRDISERVRIEENMRESEEHLQHILNNTPAAVYLKDSEGAYRTANKKFEELFRISLTDLRGKTDHQIFPQDLAEEFSQADGRVLASGTTIEGQETILYSDGAHIFDTIKFPLRNSSGVLYGMVGILSDITQKTRLEEELRNVRAHLEDRVEKRTEELQKIQTKRIRTEKLKATAQLASVVAQQINNPIHGIRNILEQVSERVQMEDIHKGLVDIAIKECGRVSELLVKLRECHAPETAEQETVDLNRVLEEVIAGDQEKLGEQVTFEKHFAQGLPGVPGSLAQIRQAIGQVIQNAEESLPDHKGRILIATEQDNDQIKIHIQDTGCGIPPENLEVIFDPFFTTKSAYKRSGLGLLLTLGVVKNHQGDIEVKSQPGKGTTFTISLPVQQAK